jgi:hypothetical protein
MIVPYGFYKMRHRQPAKRMREVCINWSELQIDALNGFYIKWKGDLFATRFSVSRCIKCQYLVSFFKERTNIPVEIVRSRFKAMYKLNIFSTGQHSTEIHGSQIHQFQILVAQPSRKSAVFFFLDLRTGVQNNSKASAAALFLETSDRYSVSLLNN